MSPVDESRNICHGSGAIQSIHRGEVVELVRLEVAQVFLHARTFKLKSPYSVPVLIELESFLIIQRNQIDINGDAMILFDQFQGGFEDIQGSQSQKVHF